MSFLPESYDHEAVSSGGGIFLKLQEGPNTLRILAPTDPTKSSAVAGWCWWCETAEGKKPFRGLDAPDPLPANLAIDNYGKPDLKPVWVLVVIDRASNSLKIWELPQATIKDGLIAVGKTMGEQTEYDVVVTKEKKGNKTKYSVASCRPAPLSAYDLQLIAGKVIQPHAMFEGGKALIDPSQDEGNFNPAPAAYVPPQNPTILDMLKASLAEPETTPERVEQLKEWALSYLDNFNAIAPDGDGGKLISDAIKPYEPAPVPTPTPALVVPAAPIAPAPVAPAPVAAVPAPVAVASTPSASDIDDIPF